MQARAGDAMGAKRTLADALKTARSIGHAWGRAFVISTVASAQAKAGDPMAAKQTFAQAKDVSDPLSRSYLIPIAKNQAEGGFFEDAIKTALNIEIDSQLRREDRVKALVDIARHLAGKPLPPWWVPDLWRTDF